MSVIGVFDSGIGGLTVAREITRTYPHVDLVYLGDTARLPYGAKSPETVTRYALNCVRFLVEAGIQTLVVACNTASACALPALRQAYPQLAIHGVVEPGAATAVAATRTGAIGVIGTEGTIRSRSYPQAIHARRADARVTALACPLLVPLAEVGWIDHAVTRLVLETYFEELFAGSGDDIDTLVLGCTHYPALKATIAEVLDRAHADRPVALVDSAEAVTAALPPTAVGGLGSRRFCVTDLPERFYRVASTFWGSALPAAEHIDITSNG